MKSAITNRHGATVVSFTGDIDLETSPQARSALLEAVAGGGTVVVDLAGVPYMDSSGIAGLIEANQAARKVGGTLVLAAVGETTLRALKLACLDLIFAIHDTVDSAVGAK